MNVFKFGGASVRDAEGVRNLLQILNTQKTNLIIVVSAMGKMTDALEKVCNYYFHKSAEAWTALEDVKNFHRNIVSQLFGDQEKEIYTRLDTLVQELEEILNSEPSLSYDYEYDRIVSFGELFSSAIVGAYLNKQGRKIKLIDIRKCLKTDETYRNANVNIELSNLLCHKTFTFQDTFMYLTQGFIAGTSTNQTTTLGREGSDYTAAILANLLDAENVTIWKDVPGIHPKTIKPLQNKKIPLFVKSFLHKEEHGSVIRELEEKLKLPPIYINKDNQLLLTLTPRDFSFIAEEKLSRIFGALAKYRLKLNLMQNSAISFSFCIDNNEAIFNSFIHELKDEYEVLYNKNVRLITIRHYTEEIIHKLIGDTPTLVEQRSRLTARFVVRKEE